jgi:3-deoxy-D-manno-octulosonic-acid transferase
MLAETAAEAGPAPAIAQDLSRRLGEPVHTLVTTVRDEALCPGVAAQAIHQIAPVETGGSIQRFLDHWRPDFGVVVGTPARPKLIGAAAQRGIPLFHAFADRKPEARLPGYLDAFHTCLAPSAAVANALRSHFKSDYGPVVEIAGPLSDTVYALPCNASDADDIAARLGGRPVWLAAEVLPGEIPMVESAHRKAYRSAHRLLLVVVPRSSGDGAAAAAQFEAAGWQVGLRSALAEPEPDIQVYVADSEGELGLWYRLAPVSFMGGTFQPAGVPADPYAPAALGSAVLHGPFTGDSPWRYERLDGQNASVLVRNAVDLGEAIIALLAPDKAASLAQGGWAATTESAHVVERLAEIMEEIVDAREAGR